MTNKISPSTPQTPTNTETRDPKIANVAHMYEKHFLGEMLKAMRSTVHEGGFIQSNMAEKIFRDQLDSEYVSLWGENGGIGLSDLIYNQIVERYGEQLGLKVPDQRPKGQIPLNKGTVYEWKEKSSDSKSQQHQFKIQQNSASSVVSPWSGSIVSSGEVNGWQQAIIDHEDGMTSILLYQGLSNPLQVGKKVQSGDVIGTLSPGQSQLHWKISHA